VKDSKHDEGLSPVRHCERSEAIQGPQYDRVGLLAPRMLRPLNCFVARAPRNDGWRAADPIDSVVIGHRLSDEFPDIGDIDSSAGV
jgi:hypothetical protein